MYSSVQDCVRVYVTFILVTVYSSVCYNESGGDQLEAFTEELEKEGKMTEDTKILMKEITEKKPAEKSAESSNIRVSDH